MQRCETDVAGFLRGTDLLGSAPAEDLRAVAAVSRARSFRRGQVVFSTGDPGDTLIVVLSGRVKVAVRSADGGELTLTIIQPGGVLGELSVADRGPRSADAETVEESRLLIVPRAVVQDICSRVPSVAQAMTATIAASLRRLTEAASDLVFLDLPRRVAKALLGQPRGERRRDPPARQPGRTRAPGRRYPAERQRRTARIRAPRVDRDRRPGRDRAAASHPPPVHRRVGRRTSRVAGRRRAASRVAGPRRGPGPSGCGRDGVSASRQGRCRPGRQTTRQRPGQANHGWSSQGARCDGTPAHHLRGA